jgi:hypothetical protein
VSKPRENTIPHHEKNPPRTAPESPPGEQTQAQSLPRYSALADELEAALELLGEAHGQRDSFTRQIESLKTERDRIGDSLLAVTNSGAGERLNEELARTESAISLNETRLAALNRKIDVEEKSLQIKMPLSHTCFERLYVFLRRQLLAANVESLRKFIHPSQAGISEIEVVAAAGKEYVNSTELALPSVGAFILSGPLVDDPPNLWTPPLTRVQKVQKIQAAVRDMTGKARRIIDACKAYPDVPAFDMEPPPPPPPSETHPEWNEALFADQSLVDRLIEASGKKRSELSEEQLAIVIRAASGHNSYLREIQNPNDRYAVGSTL